MTPEQAAALRKPFPPGAIGKLPKPYRKDSAKGQCRECGGYHGLPAVHLDYVGHAAATDRLLQVDPDWNWEPFALDPNGLPLFDSNRNLWIKLTVAGVTRVGVGDGMSLKECIGDAIRNAAMRFGVALDLWAKEDLHAMDVERGAEPEQPADPKPVPGTRTMSRKRPAATPTDPPQTGGAAEPVAMGMSGQPKQPSTPAASPDLLSKPQLTKIHVLLGEQGMGDNRDLALACLSDILGREVDSSKTLSRQDAHRVIEALETPVDPSSPQGEESP